MLCEEQSTRVVHSSASSTLKHDSKQCPPPLPVVPVLQRRPAGGCNREALPHRLPFGCTRPSPPPPPPALRSPAASRCFLLCADDPLVAAIAQQFLTDREAHDKTAAEWAKRYASA